MNTNELMSEWERIYQHILDSDTVNRSQASALLARLQPQAMSEDFLMLTADNDFIKNYIETQYSSAILEALKSIHQTDFELVIEVDPNQQTGSIRIINVDDDVKEEASPAMDQSEADLKAKLQTPPSPSVESYEVVFETPVGQGYTSPTEGPSEEEGSMVMPTSSLTFENFVIGASNQMAYSMAVAVAEDPGRSPLNPLFIYGKSGLGKTHLLRAIQNQVALTRPDLRTVYVDSADFLSGYVEATVAHDKEKSSFKNFKNTYQEADILLIDDIQFLQGKEQTLDIVFQIFNYMVDRGKQVVLSADRAPKNITMDERYQSRFNSGGTFDIQPPEIETKLGIIKGFVQEYCTTSDEQPFSLPDEISRYIAENSSSNIRELKSAVTKVIYAMNAFGQSEISIEEVSKLLENHFSGGAMKKLSITDIQKQVESYYDVPHTDLIGHKRLRKIAYARQVAIYLCREMLALPYEYIAQSFGGRDHTTIMYNYQNISDKLRTNRELAEEIENIKKHIKEM